MKFSGAIACVLSASAAIAAPFASTTTETAATTTTTLHRTQVEHQQASVKAKVRVSLSDIVHVLNIDQLAPQWNGKNGQQASASSAPVPDFHKVTIDGGKATAIGNDLKDIVDTLLVKDILSGDILNLDHVKRVVEDVLALLSILGLDFLVPFTSVQDHLQLNIDPTQLPGHIVELVLSDVAGLLGAVLNLLGLKEEVPELYAALDGQ